MYSYFVLRLFPTSYQFLGPFTEEQLCKEVKAGRVVLSDLLYCPQDPGRWSRLLNFERFIENQPLIPEATELSRFEAEAEARMKRALPAAKKETMSSSEEAKAGPVVSITANEKIWYLQSQGAEFGPFTFMELGKIFDSGKLSGKVFAWKEGLANWMEVQSLEQVLTDLPEAERTSAFIIERGSNKRVYVRSSMVATVSVRLDGQLYTGLCLDISEGGLQVGKWDAKVKIGDIYTIMITPLGLTGVAPFSAESQVTWVDQDGASTGFKFKTFKKASDQKLLADYLTVGQRGFR